MANTPLASLPYPALGDDPDIPSDIQALALAAEKQLVLVFADTTARDAAITAPAAGMLAFLTGKKWLTEYDGSNWIVISALGKIGCTATRASNLSMGAGALTAVTWTAETVDTDGFITPTSSTVTVPTGLGGLYAVTFTATFASSVTGCYARMLRNGGSTSADRWQTATATMGDVSHGITIPLDGGDTISVSVWNGGSSVNMTAGSLNVYRVAA